MSVSVAANGFSDEIKIYLIIIAGLLCYAAYRDIKTLEVPLFIVMVGTSLQTVLYIYLMAMSSEEVKIHFVSSFICGLFLFLLSCICMKYGKLGGADALISFLIGYALQIDGIIAVMLAYCMALPYMIYLHFSKKKNEYPFVPYLTVAYLLVLIYEFCVYQ